METVRDLETINEWFAKPIILAHPRWVGPPVKWAKKESTLDEAELVVLLRYIAIFCELNDIAELPNSLIGAQYPLEAVRHVHDILFGRHRRPERQTQEKRIQLQMGGRARLPVFCTYPPPRITRNLSKYLELNREIKVPQRKKPTNPILWLKTYSYTRKISWGDVIQEAKNYCDRFHIKYKEDRILPVVMKHVHDTMFSEGAYKNRKKQTRHTQYVYPGYNYTKGHL